MNISRVLDAVVAGQPSRVALVVGDREVTYGELDAAVASYARVLADHGVARGDRVAVVDVGGVLSTAAMLGTARLGAAAALMNVQLKPAELRDCLARQDRIHGATQETARQQAKLQADRSEIDRLGAELKEQMEALDRKNADAVAAYNAQVATRDKLIDSYQDAVPAFNTKVEALKAEQAAFSRACEGRRYDEDDAAAIRKGS